MNCTKVFLTPLLSLPDEFLKRWVKLSNEKPLTDEQIDSDYPAFSRQLRWQLITNKVASQENYQITLEEIKERTRMQLMQQLYQYGMRNFGEDWMEGFVEKQLADKEHVRRLNEEIMTDKILMYIKSRVKLTDTSIGFDAFKTMVEAQQ